MIGTSVAVLDTPPARPIGQYCFLMPLSPDFSQHRPDPRFDRYRDRVGRLFRSDREVGLVLVEVHPYAEVVGGWLWWRRWGPSLDALFLYTTLTDSSPTTSFRMPPMTSWQSTTQVASGTTESRSMFDGLAPRSRHISAARGSPPGEWHNCRSVRTPLSARCQPRASVAIAGSEPPRPAQADDRHG